MNATEKWVNSRGVDSIRVTRQHHGTTVVWCGGCNTELVTLARLWPAHTDERPHCISCMLRIWRKGEIA